MIWRWCLQIPPFFFSSVFFFSLFSMLHFSVKLDFILFLFHFARLAYKNRFSMNECTCSSLICFCDVKLSHLSLTLFTFIKKLGGSQKKKKKFQLINTYISKYYNYLTRKYSAISFQGKNSSKFFYFLRNLIHHFYGLKIMKIELWSSK